MTKVGLVFTVAVGLSVLGCSSGQAEPRAANARVGAAQNAGKELDGSRAGAKPGAAERAGKKLDRAVVLVKEKGDAIGRELDAAVGEAVEDVKQKLGDDPHAPPPKLVRNEASGA